MKNSILVLALTVFGLSTQSFAQSPGYRPVIRQGGWSTATLQTQYDTLYSTFCSYQPAMCAPLPICSVVNYLTQVNANGGAVDTVDAYQVRNGNGSPMGPEFVSQVVGDRQFPAQAEQQANANLTSLISNSTCSPSSTFSHMYN